MEALAKANNKSAMRCLGLHLLRTQGGGWGKLKIMKFGSLFSGIGGMDLGLERAGLECAWQVEIDNYATRVLEKHWPTVPRFRDVREVGKHNLESVDLIAGGFPCQDISLAGKGAGIDGERSGLWSEYYRIICELRPRYVLVENVAALLNRGIDQVLGNLAESGYDAEWSGIQAASFGAPHLRDRIFILAYTPSIRCRESQTEPRQNRFITAPRKGWMQQPSRAIEWISEPDICRVDDGLPNGVDRLRGLGNAVAVPVAEWIGRRILAFA